jgi:hypothetical protein
MRIQECQPLGLLALPSSDRLASQQGQCDPAAGCECRINHTCHMPVAKQELVEYLENARFGSKHG